jgi:hypothetical protein
MATAAISCECGFRLNISLCSEEVLDPAWWELAKAVTAQDNPNCPRCSRPWARAIDLAKFAFIKIDVPGKVQ